MLLIQFQIKLLFLTIIFRLTKQTVDHLSAALSFISGVFLIKIGQNFGLYNCAWRVHQMMCEDMERLLWERFVHEVKPAISNDIQQAAAEDADEISFETIPCSHFLLQNLHQLKGKD